MIKILAISGSLRRCSLNTAFLQAALHIAPSATDIRIYEGLGNLPLFNPDLEGFEPASVLNFRAQLRAAQGILIASPEYAHGITGVLKNALDWIVGSGEFVGKPVCLINTSARSIHAYEALKEVLQTMDAQICREAFRVIGLPYGINKEGILENSAIINELQSALTAFASYCQDYTKNNLKNRMSP